MRGPIRSLIPLVFATACGARPAFDGHDVDVDDAGAFEDGGIDAAVESGPLQHHSCPPYPSGPYGWRAPDVVENFSLPGNDPDDATWSMADFWCDGSTVLVMAVTCRGHGVDFDPDAWTVHDLEEWADAYSESGLALLLVAIQDSLDGARTYWEDELGYSQRWAADQTFSTGRFFEGPSVGTPAYVVLDLGGMEIIGTTQGLWSEPENLFLPYLH